MHSAIPSLRRRGVDPGAARHRASQRGQRSGWLLLVLTGLGTLTLGLALVTVFGLSLAVIGLRSVDGVGGLMDMFSRDLPAPEATFDQESFKSTFILDRNGQKLYEIFDPNGGRRDIIPLSEIPQSLIAATIATEDANFYQNPGFDIRAIFRAVLQNFRGQQVLSGASTITQQLIRNVLFDPQERVDRSANRKIKEIFLAYQLSQRYSKDQVLERYLNEINYGNLAYGIEAASQTYFNKSARDLSLAEASLLAGLPQAPSDYDPFLHFREAKERQAEVLGLMVRQGYITEDTAEAALRQELKLGRPRFDIKAAHFVHVRPRPARAEVRAQPALPRRFPRLHDARPLGPARGRAGRPGPDRPAGRPQRDRRGRGRDQPELGEILAMVGSADYFNPQIAGQVNMATAVRQPGSVIKPFTYAAAFTRGTLSPGSVIVDEQTQFRGAAGEPYTPSTRTAASTARSRPATRSRTR